MLWAVTPRSKEDQGKDAMGIQTAGRWRLVLAGGVVGATSESTR